MTNSRCEGDVGALGTGELGLTMLFAAKQQSPVLSVQSLNLCIKFVLQSLCYKVA